jgi:hypothetical protein
LQKIAINNLKRKIKSLEDQNYKKKLNEQSLKTMTNLRENEE